MRLSGKPDSIPDDKYYRARRMLLQDSSPCLDRKRQGDDKSLGLQGHGTMTVCRPQT